MDDSVLQLHAAQHEVTKAADARVARDEIAFRLWISGAMTQREIAAELDRADRAAGGTGVSAAAIEKQLFRMRKAREQQLLQAAP